MKTKLLIILIVLTIVTVAYAADKKWSIITANTTVADADEMLLIDIGTGDSQKITVLNLFDTIDTSAELIAILTNETGTGALVFATSPTLVTPALGAIASGVGTALTALNGENIQADTIDDDSIDFGDVTGVDLTLTDCGAITSTGTITATVGFDIVGAADIDYGSVDVTDHTFVTDGTGDSEIVLPNDSIGDNEIDWSGLTTSADFTVTGTLITSVGIDGVGAVDLDYGSVDITDHTFTTDDMTFIMDGGITVSTGDFIKIGTTQWNSADEIDGTKIKDADYGDIDVSAGGAWTLDTGSVADNEIDYANVTFADFDYETAWKMWHSNAAGDVTEITLGADTTFLESNGAAAAPAFRALADGDIPDGITIDLATLATTVTVTDDEATADNQEIVFTTDNTNLESDGNFHYNPNTGTATAPEFVGGGAGITGLSVTYENIGDPGASGSISFDDGETATYTSANDSAVSFFSLVNSDADHTVGGMYLLDLDYSADDGDAQADFVKCQDSGGVVLSIQQNGDLTTTGNIQLTKVGDSPILSLIDGDAKYFSIQKFDAGKTILFNNEGAIDLMPSNDMGDYLSISTAAGVVTIETIADDDGDLVITAGGGDISTASTLEAATITEGAQAVINATQGGAWTGVHDFGGADLEIPQAAPAVPGVDGGIEVDFTDGKVVIQHSSGHAELGASTDVVVGTLIKSWSGTIFEPDGVNDVLTVKAINSIEFPHGVVITAVYLGVSENSNYVLTVQNFDDFDTINAGNGTIDTVTYTADTTGEIIDTTPTYATIAAGQIIMISIPATDVDWCHFEIYYYEPAA